MKKALITGITGQDGSYPAELLLQQSYEFHGIIRRSSSFNTARIDPLYRDPHGPEARLKLHYGDLTYATSLRSIVESALNEFDVVTSERMAVQEAMLTKAREEIDALDGRIKQLEEQLKALESKG